MSVHVKPPNRLIVLAAQLALTFGFLAAWQWGANTGHIDTFFFASPLQIGASIAKWWSHNYVINDVAVTMEETLLGNVTRIQSEMEKMSPNAKAIERYVSSL